MVLLLLTTEDIFIELLKDDIESLLKHCDFKKAFLEYIAKDIHIKYLYGIHPQHVLSPLSKIKEICLVGFDGSYFAKRFLSFSFESFIPPNVKILLLAKKKGLDKLFPQLILDDLNENMRRFENFIENGRWNRTNTRRYEVQIAPHF